LEVRQTFTPSSEKLLLGVSVDGPVFSPITGLLSTLVIGRPGSGKTTLLRLIATEAIEAGVRVVCWDLHSDLNVAGVELATTEEDIARSAEAITTELDHRRRNGRGAPICLMADELPLLATVPAAMASIKRVVLEGRKYAIYCLLSGQAVPAAIFTDGGAMVRSACASRFVFRSNRMEARRSGLEDRLDMANVNTLPTGVAILDGACVTKPTLVSIPRLDGAPAAIMAPRPTTGSYTASGTLPGSGSSTEVHTGSMAEAVKLVRSGQSPTAALRATFGVDGGRRFGELRAELAAALGD
jgi:DNA helicase HerA-like ATPase